MATEWQIRRAGGALRSLLAVAAALLLVVTASVARAAPTELDRVIAIVDDDVILASELLDRMRDVVEQFRTNEQEPPPRDILASQVLERLILESLQLQLGDRAGVRLSDDELTSGIARLAQQNGMALEQFVEQIQQQGMSYRQFRDRVRREMIIARVQQNQVNGRIRLSPREVQGFLDSPIGRASTGDEYRVGHILLTVAEDASTAAREEARALAQTLVERARAGEEFASLAVAHSSASTALEGGDLGWRKAGQLPTLFAEPVLGARAGDVLDPIEVTGGIHVVKVLETRGFSNESVAQTRARHILIRPNEIRDEAESRELIRDLHARLEAGEPFDELAREHSDDPGSALNGGDLGWVQSDQLEPRFAEMMESLPVGELSGVFRSTFGYHVLEVLERRDQNVGEEMRERQAFMILRQRRFDEELQAWLRELREDAFIEIKI